MKTAQILENIDDLQGTERLVEAMRDLAVSVQSAQKRPAYQAAVKVCFNSRSAWAEIKTECQINPAVRIPLLAGSLPYFKSGLEAVEKISKTSLTSKEAVHVKGMISNISHRIQQAEALAQPGSLREAFSTVRRISASMVLKQKEIQAAQLTR